MLIHEHGELGWGGNSRPGPQCRPQERGAQGCPDQTESHWGLGSPQVLMSAPYEGEGRGVAMLNLLRTLSHSIAPSMADMWELEIPLLVSYLEGEAPSQCAGWGTD